MRFSVNSKAVFGDRSVLTGKRSDIRGEVSEALGIHEKGGMAELGMAGNSEENPPNAHGAERR